VSHEPDWLCCLDADTGKILWKKSINLLWLEQGPEGERLRAMLDQKTKNDAIWLPIREEVRALETKLKGDSDNADLKAKLADANARMAEPKRLGDEAFAAILGKIRYHGVGWKTLIGYAFSTPITDGTFLYIRNATGALACVDVDGNIKWMRDFPYNNGNSTVVSLAMADGKVVYSWPAEKDTMRLTAMDRETGKTVWETDPIRKGSDDGTVTPLVVTFKGIEILITGGGDIFRASDGIRLAKEVGSNTFCAPAFHDDTIYFLRNGDVDAVQLTLAEADRIEAKKLWTAKPRVEGKNSSMYGGPVYYDGYLHILEDLGHYFVIDTKDGKVVHASMILTAKPGEDTVCIYNNLSVAGGRIYGIDQKMSRGIILTPGPEAKVLGRNNGLGNTTSTPTFAGDRIYLHTVEGVFCIGAKAGK
jgi:outer membrane protein assembly factor BamB